MRIGIVGAGVAGATVALEALRRGWDATVFDDPDALPACSTTAAGMLAPHAELETAGREMFELGMRALEIWPELLSLLPTPVYFRREGSLVMAHANDAPQLRRLLDLIERKTGERFAPLERDAIEALEPDLALRGQVVHLPAEGQIDTQGFIDAARAMFRSRGMLREIRVDEIGSDGSVLAGGERIRFDHIFDCRGVGAKPDVPNLRGVRGELVWVHAPGLSIRRPLRLMHPRYRGYIVPRPGNIYIVGASEIESESRGPITVRTVLELLSALFAVQPAFGEAELVRTDANLRPAYPDNAPRVEHEGSVTRINGLFRHGFLLAPALAVDAVGEVSRMKETTHAADRDLVQR